MHMPYETQLKTKQSSLNTTLAKQLGHGHEVKPTTPSPNTTAYRNKIELTVQNDKIGFLSPNSHKIIEIADCPLCNPSLKTFLETARPLLKTNTTVRNIVIRTVENTTAITFVTNTRQKFNLKPWLEPLKAQFRNLSVFQNINTKKTSEVFGPKFVHLYGPKTQTIHFMGIKYNVSPYAFLQINDAVASQIYAEVLNQIPQGSNVINAYSGAGLLTALISKNAKHVIGIEINLDATQNANRLMSDNNITNAENICGDCAKLTSVLYKFSENKSKIIKNNQKNNVFNKKTSKNCEIIDFSENNLEDQNKFILIVDPPRKGLDTAFLDACINARPEKVIYISCNPATLSRDLKRLMPYYKISLIQPFDMFPHTKHIETLCVLNVKSAQK